MTGITELLKGVLEGAVMQIISRGETYGYEITNALQEQGFDDIVEGTVYTILMRLEKKNLVTVEKKKSPVGPMRKFYTLNDAGRIELSLFWERWGFVSDRMNEMKEI